MEEEIKDTNKEEATVLQVMLEELSVNQEVAGQQLTQLSKDVLVLSKLLNQLAQKPPPPPLPDQTIAINAAIEKGFNKLAKSPSADAKTVREYKILLFPEQDRKLFYRIVFGRWLLYLVIMLALNNAYKIALHYSDNQKQVEMGKTAKSRLEASWQYVYDHSSKATKRLMENAYQHSNSADTVLIKH